MKTSFSEFELLDLKEDVLKGVLAYGYHTPSSIQKQAIPAIAKGKSAVVQSKNGTGKTATFILGMLQRISPSIKGVQAVILSPTRDLALQTFSVFNGLSQFMEIKGHCAVGGDKTVASDLQSIQKNRPILCGTPGRVLQLIKQSAKSFENVHMIILDEADRVLDSGFGMQVKSIFDHFKGATPQFVFVSATLPKTVTEMLECLLEKPQMFLMPQDILALPEITQYYVRSRASERFEMIYEIFSSFSITQAVIFANKKDTVISIEDKLKTHGFSVTAIHSAIEQSERNKRMDEFFSGRHRILVSTDVSSRGIDAAHVNLVINYDIPQSAEEYLHRIGRGGRFGKTSLAFTLTASAEVEKIQAICRTFGQPIHEFIP